MCELHPRTSSIIHEYLTRTTLNNGIPTISSNNNTTAASAATMEQRLAYYEKSCNKAEKRIEKKKALDTKLEEEFKALDKQHREAKHAPIRDMKGIEALDEVIKENHAEVKTEAK